MASTRIESATQHLGRKNTTVDLANYGIDAPARVYWNLNTPELYEEIARRNEGAFSDHGNIIVDTGLLVTGPPIGTDTTGQSPEGAPCV